MKREGERTMLRQEALNGILQECQDALAEYQIILQECQTVQGEYQTVLSACERFRK